VDLFEVGLAVRFFCYQAIASSQKKGVAHVFSA